MECPSSQLLPKCERCFRSAFHHAAIGVALIDKNGAFIYGNHAFCKMTGYEEQELCGMHFTATLHPDDRVARSDVFRQIVAGAIGSFTNERRMVRKDGTMLWVRTSITVPSELTVSPMVIAFVEDITEQKRAEDALRASEERFRIAAENASDVIYEWDLRSGEVGVFGRDQRLGDWPPPRSYEAWRGMVHPEDLERAVTELKRHIQTGERYHAEYRIVGRSGKIFHYNNRGEALRDAAGEPYKWVGLAADITEKKLAEEAIAQLAAIVQCSESAIFATDPCGHIRTWNDGAQGLLGYSAAEVREQSVRALLASPPVAREILSQIERGQSSRLDEAWFLRKDGSQVPVLLSVSPIRKRTGEITGSAVIARDISERKRVEKEMAHRALHDPLTGLPNRVLLAHHLAQSITSAEQDASGAAVVFIDLDGFKFVNDTLGHEAGDALLQEVGKRLNACVRRGDLLARMGGDEFMLVVNGVSDDQLAVTIAERLAATLRGPFFVDHHELVMTASMGISMYPTDGTDVSTLQRNADAAMYEAKQAGKDRIRFYRPELGAAFQARLQLETELRRAIDREQIHLEFQPIFSAADRRLTAYEALSRWRLPNGDFVPPNRFIPVAEETGLIIRLGEWVLREACRQCHRWQDHGKPSVRVAVNVSPLQFAHSDFVDTVLGVLRDTELAGELLDLEVTESIVMRDIDSAIEKMAKLRQHGIRISVDDFGTGYSSLGYLPKLPIDTLKIDRCFVAQIGENDAAVALIQGMISLAHSISKRVIVEGVETAAQLETLRRLQCDEVQGFFLGRPECLEYPAERRQETTQQLIA